MKIHIRRSENTIYDLEASLESYGNTLKIVTCSQYVIVNSGEFEKHGGLFGLKKMPSFLVFLT
jgi:hypothetical protein